MSFFSNSLPALTQCLADLCTVAHHPGQRAMARNLLSEHRVSQLRFTAFSALVPVSAISPKELAEAINIYQKHIRPNRGASLDPAYEHPANANNRVVLSSGTQLGTVIDLSRHAPAYVGARNSGVPEFSTFGGTSPAAEEVNTFLREQLEGSVDPRPFLAAAFNAIATHATKLHLTWAAEWSSFQPYLSPKTPARWLQGVGVAKEDPVWLAVVRYHPPNPVFRPTQLDAGWYPWHFPSPPQAPTEAGGLTVDLGHGSPKPAQGLVQEYIHRQIEFTVDDWDRAGSLVGFLPGPNYADLEFARHRHLNTLERHFPGAISWMPVAV